MVLYGTFSGTEVQQHFRLCVDPPQRFERLRVIEKSISYCTVIDADNAQNAEWRHYLFGAIALKTPLSTLLNV